MRLLRVVVHMAPTLAASSKPEVIGGKSYLYVSEGCRMKAMTLTYRCGLSIDARVDLKWLNEAKTEVPIPAMRREVRGKWTEGRVE